MIQFTTTIDVEQREVRVEFHGETHTFCYDHNQFPIGEALKVAAEHMEAQLLEWLGKLRPPPRQPAYLKRVQCLDSYNSPTEPTEPKENTEE